IDAKTAVRFTRVRAFGYSRAQSAGCRRERDKDVAVFLIVLIFLTASLTFLAWHLVHSSPPVLARLLPRGLTQGVGMFLFFMGLFAAYLDAMVRNPHGLMGAFIQTYVGLWFMLATSAGMRGSESDESMLRRLFLMIGMAMGILIAMLYLPHYRVVSVLDL